MKHFNELKLAKNFQSLRNFANHIFEWFISLGYFSSTTEKSTATSIVKTNSDPTGGIRITFTKTDFDDVEIGGFQYGEKFGYSICAVDIDNDGFDDLVVGAPFHARNEQVKSSKICIFIELRFDNFH